MMLKKIITYCCLIAVMAMTSQTNLNAQSKTFDGVLSAQLRNMGPIIKDKIVAGYYMFYKVDKVDRKNREYLLQILDANLNVLGSKKIIDSKHVVLLEATYNGELIMMKFYDRKKRAIDYRAYDQKADQVYTKSRKLEKKWELTPYANVAESAEISNATVFPVLNKGFVEYGLHKAKKFGYEIKYYPNEKGTKGWTKKSKPDAKLHETANFVGVDENIVLSQILKTKSRLNTKGITYHLLALDTKTGKRVFEKELVEKKYELAILNTYLREDGSGEIAVLGQFYKKGANTFKDKSLGLFSFLYSKEGKIISRNFAKWEKDVGKFVGVNSKGKLDDVGYVYFHEVVQTADGKIFAIGETFKKTANALGIAAVALGGRGSLTKVTIKDMAIFQFSPSFELEDVQFFDKSKSHVDFGEGSSLTRIFLLGRLIEAYGYFDYAFTQRSNDNSEFVVGYVDYQRNKGARNEFIFGAIAYADGEITTDKISLKAGKRGRQTKGVFQAKPGYVMVTEYVRKEKKLYMDLEKINY